MLLGKKLLSKILMKVETTGGSTAARVKIMMKATAHLQRIIDNGQAGQVCLEVFLLGTDA